MKFTSILKNGVILGLAALMFVPMGFCSESIPNVSISQNDTQIRELADSIAQKLYEEQSRNKETTVLLEKDKLVKIVQEGLKNGAKEIQPNLDDRELRIAFREYIAGPAYNQLSEEDPLDTIFENVPAKFYSDFTNAFREIVNQKYRWLFK